MVNYGTGIALTITAIISSMAAMTGNILVLVAIIKSRRLHTTSNMYICALAFTDIYISIIYPIKYILRLSGVDLSHSQCEILVATGILGCFMNLMMIEVISIDRFYAIYWPFQYRKYCTRSRAIKMSVLVAVVSTALGAVLFAVFRPVEYFGTCWGCDVVTVPIATVMTVITCCVALELSVMYGAMFYKAVQHQKTLSIGYFDKNSKDMSIFDIKALKTCSVVLGSFLMTWCPPLIVINLAAYSTANYDLAFALCMMLPAINAALDPVVYAIMREDIQKGIRRLFRKPTGHVFTQVQHD